LNENLEEFVKCVLAHKLTVGQVFTALLAMKEEFAVNMDPKSTPQPSTFGMLALLLKFNHKEEDGKASKSKSSVASNSQAAQLPKFKSTRPDVATLQMKSAASAAASSSWCATQ